MSNIEIFNSSLITTKTFIDEYDFDKHGVLNLTTYKEGHNFYSIKEIIKTYHKNIKKYLK